MRGQGQKTLTTSTKHQHTMRAAAELLSREEFRFKVFSRDKHKCVVCGQAAVDAHHLIERRLWEDQGYYLDNGVSLCQKHHIKAEETNISPSELRRLAGIETTILPEQLDTHEQYDKWGNIYLANGMRSPGPLFNDQSVQKILRQGKVLDQFTDYIKYPRTPHLPFSGSVNSDDIQQEEIDHFREQEVIISEKLDGECTVIYADGHVHARSLDSGYHPSRTRVKALAARLANDLPRGWRICGENMVAQHSIAYHDIPHFMIFSIWNEHNQCLNWQESKEWAKLLEVPLAPILYEGKFDEDILRCCWQQSTPYADESEGFVIRLAQSFSYSQFADSVAKFVRPDHITDQRHHWLSQNVNYNQVLEL